MKCIPDTFTSMENYKLAMSLMAWSMSAGTWFAVSLINSSLTSFFIGAARIVSLTSTRALSRFSIVERFLVFNCKFNRKEWMIENYFHVITKNYLLQICDNWLRSRLCFRFNSFTSGHAKNSIYFSSFILSHFWSLQRLTITIKPTVYTSCWGFFQERMKMNCTRSSRLRR